MNRPSPPLISPEEWQALQAQWPDEGHSRVDVWFPWRVWLLLLITSVFAVALLFTAPRMSVYLAQEPVLVEMLTRFLYFRGWLVVVATALGVWAYMTHWHLSRVFGILTAVSVVNLISDFFIVYPERLAHPTLGFVVQLAARLLAMAALYQCYRNAHRVPAREDRFNILLPFRHHPHPNWRSPA